MAKREKYTEKKSNEIAEYFNVSVDYLLNETETITTNKSSAQEELFKLVGNLSDDESGGIELK